jgi:probable phosphoglycerate mutase
VRIFVLARHGQSTLNEAQLINGDPARDCPLTPRGREEAERLGVQVRHLELDVCVHSRFPRTRETAELALAGREVPLVVEPLLDDIDVGELEGVGIDDYRTWKRGHRRFERFPGGESLDEAALRYAEAFRLLLERDDLAVLVICHEIPVRYALNAAAGSPELEGPLRRVGNAVPYLFDETALVRAIEGIELAVAASSA